MENTIIISCGKHAGGGGLTIVKQILKLFPEIKYFHRDKNVLIGKYFSDIEELPESKNVIFLSSVYKGFDLFLETVEKYKGSYLIHLQVDRFITSKKLNETKVVSENFHEVWHYSKSPTILKGYNQQGLFKNKNLKLINIDINTYNFNDEQFKPLSERKNLIFTASRFGGFKTTNVFIENFRKVVNENELFKEYPYFFYGLNYNFSGVTGKVIGEPGFVVTVCEDLKNKKIKKYININREFDETKIRENELNIFSSYSNRDDWQNYLTYIYTTMAISKNELESQQKNRIRKYTPCFNMAIEYVLYEAIDAGVPILLSKAFMEAALPELLETKYYYDYIEEIPEKIKYLISDENIYREIYEKQKKLLIKKSTEANNSIIREINRIKGM